MGAALKSNQKKKKRKKEKITHLPTYWIQQLLVDVCCQEKYEGPERSVAGDLGSSHNLSDLERRIFSVSKCG